MYNFGSVDDAPLLPLFDHRPFNGAGNDWSVSDAPLNDNESLVTLKMTWEGSEQGVIEVAKHENAGTSSGIHTIGLEAGLLWLSERPLLSTTMS